VQNGGALRMLGECQKRCHLKIWFLDWHDIRTFELQTRAKGTGTILINVTGECATELS
jgi:hypothetical protein